MTKTLEPISVGNCPSCNHYPTQFVGEDGLEYVIHLPDPDKDCQAASVHGAIKHYREKNQDLAIDLWNAQQKADDLKDQIRAQEADILELYRAIRTQKRGDSFGMKLVPWEPTDKQVEEGSNLKVFNANTRTYVTSIYKAMVSAAPGPDKETPQIRGLNASLVILDDANHDKPDHWAAKNPGQADQYRAEAQACRRFLGFQVDDGTVGPSDLSTKFDWFIAQAKTGASDEGYDEACRVISEGLGKLMDALSLDHDQWGDDAAEAAVISGILSHMARQLEPLPVKYDEEENEIRLNPSALKQRIDHLEQLLLEHVIGYENDINWDEEAWHNRVIESIEHRIPDEDDPQDREGSDNA